MFLNDNVLLPYLKLVPIKKSKSSKISLDIPFIVKFVTQVIMQFGSQIIHHSDAVHLENIESCKYELLEFLVYYSTNTNQKISQNQKIN